MPVSRTIGATTTTSVGLTSDARARTTNGTQTSAGGAVRGGGAASRYAGSTAVLTLLRHGSKERETKLTLNLPCLEDAVAQKVGGHTDADAEHQGEEEPADRQQTQ